MDTFTPWRALSIAVGAFVLLASASVPQARVTKIVISQVTSPLFNGQTFGSVGQYEMLRGIAYSEIDPTDRRNTVITDIAFAPCSMPMNKSDTKLVAAYTTSGAEQLALKLPRSKVVLACGPQ